MVGGTLGKMLAISAGCMSDSDDMIDVADTQRMADTPRRTVADAGRTVGARFDVSDSDRPSMRLVADLRRTGL